MKTIFMASKFEADFFIKDLSKVNESFYEGDYRVVITGVGLVNTTSSCTKYFEKYPVDAEDEVINAGICGSVSAEIAIGSIVEARCFSVYSPVDVPGSSANIYQEAYPVLGGDGLHIASSLCPLWGKEHYPKLKAQHIDLIDMEAYAFASVCARENVSFTVVKGVSDHLVKDSQSDFRRHATEALSALKKLLTDS